MRTAYLLSAAACVPAFAQAAFAQTAFNELEPNSLRTEATVVSCLAPGDTLSGSTTGTLTGPGDVTLPSADVFRVQTCALPAGIYRHELALASATPGLVTTLRGLAQAGAPGAGGTATGIDATLSTGSGDGSVATPRTSAWYGFGGAEELYWRVTGNGSTTQPYTATFSTSAISALALGTFVAGPLTISCVGQGHLSDTDLWLYDANLQAIAGAGNDDKYQTGLVQSELTRTLAPGTYYLALAGYNLANHLTTPADDDFAQGHVLDFPGALATNRTTANYALHFTVSDAGQSVPVTAVANVLRSHEVLFFRFEVVSAVAQPFCFGDGTLTDHTTPCPCANDGGPGRGCANSFQPAGAQLTLSGAAANDDVVLHSNGTPTFSFTLFLQHAAAGDQAFHDGVLCAGGSMVRLRGRNAAAGQAAFPDSNFANDQSLTLSQRGGVAVGSSALRYYSAWYRNASTTFCPPATANVTNGWRLVW